MTLDGRFGLLARGGAGSFDTVTVKTNDRAFSTGNALLAAPAADAPATAGRLAPAQIETLVGEALRRWSVATDDRAVAATASSVQVTVTDLPGLRLGEYVNGNVLIDVDAAGSGWFVDPTPGDDREYVALDESMVATSGGARGRMDLLSVLAHELGHARGLDHDDGGVMAESLAPGFRVVPFEVVRGEGVAAGGSGRIDFDRSTGAADGGAALDDLGTRLTAGASVDSRPTSAEYPSARPMIDWLGKTMDAAMRGLRDSTAMRRLAGVTESREGLDGDGLEPQIGAKIDWGTSAGG